MIRVGESTGSLDEQLHTAATFYERELEYRLKRVTDMFEPTILKRAAVDAIIAAGSRD